MPIHQINKFDLFPLFTLILIPKIYHNVYISYPLIDNIYSKIKDQKHNHNKQQSQIAMQLLQRMNKKMDQGYKLTSYPCTFCNGVTLMKEKQDNVYCPKCDKEYKPVLDEKDDQYFDSILDSQPISQTATQPKNNQNIIQSIQSTPKPQPQSQPQDDDQAQKSYNQFLALYNSTAKTPAQQKSQKVSKKMGQLLISGWAMLEQACQSCNVPLMKSKKGNMICCGCDRDYAENQESKVQGNKQEQTKIQMKKQAVKQKMEQKPIAKNPSPMTDNRSPQVTISQSRSSSVSQKIENMSFKTLQFLQRKLEYAFSNNDLETVERVLRILKSVKQLQ